MQNPDNTTADLDLPAEPLESRPLPWHAAVSQLLSQAAALCIEHGVDVDAYMSGAWAAYVEARPGMRDQLEEMQLRDQLDELRRLGRLASA
ncbi:MAG TPA: hypothetical protein VFK02_25460 [Kofleriaceae bacterium]|nr:hypothetical protein [Kofleriaceae bacterium]